jgi:ParB family chromosome partitioning protein
MGHARALLSLSDPALQLELYKRIIKEGLSVRRVEELAKQMNGQASRPKEPGKAAAAEYDVLKKHLSNVFRTPVRLDVNAQGRGKITFPFRDEEEMARLISLFDTLHAQDVDQ